MSVLVSLLLTVAPATLLAPPAESGPARDAAQTRELGSLRVEVGDPELEAFPTELALRVPHVPLLDHSEPPRDPHAWVRVRRMPTLAQTYEITLVVSDGRGYFRTLEITDPEPARVVAASVANLIFAVEDGTAAPDREDAVIPPPEPEARAEPPEAAVEPESDESTGDSETPAPPPTSPGLRLGMTVGAELVLAPGPPTDVPVLAAGGGDLSARVRGPRGGTGWAGVRVAGREADGLGLLRIRVALGGGYGLARPRFELDVLGFGFVEPWTVIGKDSVRPRPRPLLGLGLRVAAGYPIVLGRSTVRVGPRVEVALAGVPADGMRAVRLVRAEDGSAALGAGGVELVLGLEAVWWWGLRGTQPGSSSSRGSPSSTSAPSSGTTRTTLAGSGRPGPP